MNRHAISIHQQRWDWDWIGPGLPSQWDSMCATIKTESHTQFPQLIASRYAIAWSVSSVNAEEVIHVEWLGSPGWLYLDPALCHQLMLGSSWTTMVCYFNSLKWTDARKTPLNPEFQEFEDFATRNESVFTSSEWISILGQASGPSKQKSNTAYIATISTKILEMPTQRLL